MKILYLFTLVLFLSVSCSQRKAAKLLLGEYEGHIDCMREYDDLANAKHLEGRVAIEKGEKGKLYMVTEAGNVQLVDLAINDEGVSFRIPEQLVSKSGGAVISMEGRPVGHQDELTYDGILQKESNNLVFAYKMAAVELRLDQSKPVVVVCESVLPKIK